MAEQELFTPKLHSRSIGGPASSNICAFQVDLFPGVSYAAYALSDGCIVVQQVLAARDQVFVVKPLIACMQGDAHGSCGQQHVTGMHPLCKPRAG